MTLKGLSASYGERIHDLFSEGADQRVYGAPAGAVPRYDYSQAELVQLDDRLSDYVFVRRHEVQPSDHRVQRHVGKDLLGVATDVQQPGMGAAREDRDPLAPHMSGHESLVLDKGVGLPLPAGRALEMVLQAALEAPAGDLAAEIEQPAQDLLRLGGCYNARATFFEYSTRRHILQRKDRSIWQPHAPFNERPGVHVERDRPSTVGCANQFYGP